MTNTRRAALGAILGAGAASGQLAPNTPEGERAWMDFAVEWNKLADSLRAGVFDQRQWKRVQTSFRHLEHHNDCR